jgi:tetratricopeptide (TPR) repeat protein
VPRFTRTATRVGRLVIVAACTALIDAKETSPLKRGVAYYNRATGYAGRRQFDRAIADFDEAIRLEPRNAAAYFNRGVSHAETRD